MNLEKATGKAIEIVNATHREIFEDYISNNNSISIANKDGYEVVSETDKRASDFLIDRLGKAFPDIPVISEESPPETFKNVPDIFWLIDPIDGTFNFIRRIPYSSVSVSLISEGSPVIGITKDIFNGDIYHAYLNGGFYKNGSKTRRVVITNQKILSTGFKPSNPGLHQRHMLNLVKVFHHFSDIRRFASACLDLCLLCEGKLNVVFEVLRAWDCYAGIIMAEETGLKSYISADNIPLDNDAYFICGEEELVDAICKEADLSIDSG